MVELLNKKRTGVTPLDLVSPLDLVDKGFRYGVILVTPEWANMVLREFNISNRNLKKENVAKLMKAIYDDRFKLNFDPILFDHNNILINGQHRLWAVVKSGISVEALVICGVDPDIYSLVDRGQKKNLGDDLKREGFKNNAQLAQMANLIYKYRNGTMKISGGSTSIPPEVGKEMVKRNNDKMQESIRWGHKWNGALNISAGGMAFCHYIFAELEREDADYFFERVQKGIGLEEDDPEYRLRQKILKKKEDKRSLVELQGLTIKAWNSYRRGESIKNIIFSPGGKRKEDFPKAI